jgi:ATP-binding cassette subfamily C (CFTR/MRP) protein 1
LRFIWLINSTENLMALADVLIILKGGKIDAIGSPEALRSEGYIVQHDREHSQASNIEETEQGQVETSSNQESPSLEQSMESSCEIEDEAKEDDPRRKQGDSSVYKYYLSSSGYFTTLSFIAFTMASVFCTEFPSKYISHQSLTLISLGLVLTDAISAIWLKWWAEANARQPNQNVGMYMGVFAAVGILGVLVTGLACWFAFIRIISNSALHLHSALLRTTMNAPFRYFVAVDTGSLINRFKLLCLARAMLRKSKILILDEAMSK